MDIAITGMGAVTPLGGSVDESWRRLCAGESGVRDIADALDEPSALPVTIGAPMAVDPADSLDRITARRLDRVQQAALVASTQAWEDAGKPDVDPTRLAVVLATGVGGISTIVHQQSVLDRAGARRVSPRTVPMLMANAGAAQVSIAYQARAGAYTPVSACSSGAEAFVAGARLLALDEADMVIVGGADAALTPLTVAAFANSGALCTRYRSPDEASRPFDRDRAGFVLGEGAAVAVLERTESARARGRRGYARLAGYAVTSDAYHITAPDPSGAEQARAMVTAVRRAGLSTADIGHVNCHATSTEIGDVIEARSIRSAIGDHPVLSAPKASLGHLVGAAGAVEAVIAALSVAEERIPPTINLTRPDPEIGLETATTTRPLHGAVLSNSFAFGGQNVALVFTPV